MDVIWTWYVMSKTFPCRSMSGEHEWKCRTRQFSSSRRFGCVTIAFAFCWYGMCSSALGFSFYERPPSPFREVDDPVRIACSLGLLSCEPFLKMPQS